MVVTYYKNKNIMYYLLESNSGKFNVIGQFSTILDAEDEKCKMHNEYCDYFISKLITNN
jgi:hypothetical protein